MRLSLISELNVWLDKEYAAPDLRRFLITGLTSWLNDPFSDKIEYDIAGISLFAAASVQVEIGWYALLCGYIATPLVTIQQQHYSAIE